jgi:hypothetical protein
MSESRKDGSFRTALALAEYRARHWAESFEERGRLQLVHPGDGALAEGGQEPVSFILLAGRLVDEEEQSR